LGGYLIPFRRDTRLTTLQPPVTVDPKANKTHAAWLEYAAPLMMDRLPLSAPAMALCVELTAVVAAYEARVRKRPRGPKGRLKLADAVGRIVASVIRTWMTEAKPVRMSLNRNSFVGRTVAQDQFLPVVKALVRAGLLATAPGIRRPPSVWEDEEPVWGQGRSTRYWPRQGLLDCATTHGVTADTVASDFTWNLPARIRPPKVVHLVRMTSFRDPVTKKKHDLRIDTEDRVGQMFATEVRRFNESAATFELTGCAPPRWSRIFTAAWPLGGRWTALGAEGNYQVMSEARRVKDIFIDGETVAEVDVSSCHLSIMHGLLRMPLPDGDLFEFAGLPRSVVKQWVVMALGKGSPVKSWTARSHLQVPEVRDYKAVQVGAAIQERYPFMTKPAVAVVRAAGLDRDAQLGKPQKLLIHRLMGIEADALTDAMKALMFGAGSSQTLALPMHDGLIVPSSQADATSKCLVDAFQRFASVAVRTKTIVAG
jgi:hypothetical protein